DEQGPEAAVFRVFRVAEVNGGVRVLPAFEESFGPHAPRTAHGTGYFFRRSAVSSRVSRRYISPYSVDGSSSVPSCHSLKLVTNRKGCSGPTNSDATPQESR